MKIIKYLTVAAVLLFLLPLSVVLDTLRIVFPNSDFIRSSREGGMQFVKGLIGWAKLKIDVDKYK